MGVKFGTEEETKGPLLLAWRRGPFQNVEYKRPAGAYPSAILTKFAEFVPHFRMC